MSTAPSIAQPSSYRFGNAQLFPVERRLVVDGEAAAVGARAFDVLLALLERHDRLVRRDELLDLCWPDAEVEPNNLAVQILALRRILGHDMIASVAGRGYRLSVEVEVVARPVLALVEPAVHRTNLPDLSPLIGRDDDLRSVTDLVDAQRLVSIVGAGGIGKTRLAQQVLDARRDAWRHGVCWIELGAVADAASLPSTIAAALGIGLRGSASASALASAIGTLEILIALDNAEHLLDDIGALVDAVLQAAPGVRIVVTSQAPLGLRQEQQYRLGPLTLPPGRVSVEQAARYGALEFFVQRVRTVDPRFTLTDANVGAVAELCERLDGLPLAIELAAARVALLGVDQVADSMNQRFEWLTGGFRNAPARHRTMMAALDWSHRHLGANERIVFRRLAVVVGSASFDLAQAIAVDIDHATPDAVGALDKRAVVDALVTLVDRSLVSSVTTPGSNRRRYRLLEMPRAYAAERLVDAGERAMLEERHARAVADLLGRAWVERWTGTVGYREWIERVDADCLNGRAAYAWARKHDGFDLILAMAPVLLNRVLPSSSYEERIEIATLLDERLAAVPASQDHLPARMGLMRHWLEHDVAQSLEEASLGLALAETFGHRFAAYACLAWQVRALAQTGEIERARNALAKVDALEDPAWPPIKRWMGSDARVVFHHFAGPREMHLEVLHRELEITRLSGEPGHVVRGNLVDAQLMAGNADEAVAMGRQLVDEMADSRNALALVVARINLAAGCLATSQLDSARSVLRDAWQTARHFALHGDCADYMALLAAMDRRWTVAATIVGHADHAYQARRVQRWPHELQVHEQTLQLIGTALDAAALERCMNDGRQLTHAQIETLAFVKGP